MKMQPDLFFKPPGTPPGFGVRQSSAALGGRRNTVCGYSWLSRPPTDKCQEQCEGTGAAQNAGARGVGPERRRNVGRASAFKGAFRIALIACLALVVWDSLSVSGAEFRLGEATALPGTVVNIPATLADATGAVGAQCDVRFDPSVLTLVGFALDPGLPDHVVDQQELAPGRWRALVYSTTNGPIAPGAVVWLSFAISPNALDGVVPLVLSNAIVAQASGQRVEPLALADGAITVISPTPEGFTSAELAGPGLIRATIEGLAGRVVTLQGTPDFFHWADLGNYTNTSGTLVITNAVTAGQDVYFYRTVFPAISPSPIPAISLSADALLPDGRIRLPFELASASAWRVEGSPDQFHWGNYGVLANQGGILALTNGSFTKSGVYFYRVSQP